MQKLYSDLLKALKENIKSWSNLESLPKNKQKIGVRGTYLQLGERGDKGQVKAIIAED